MHVAFVTLSSQGVLPRALNYDFLTSEVLLYLVAIVSAYIRPNVLRYLKEIPAITVKQTGTAKTATA